MGLIEKRFGTVAVENKMISVEQLEEALNLQVEEDVEGKEHRLLGVILEALGYITEEQINKILLHLDGQRMI
ncbi:MAG: hypothetical protein ABIJ31_01485 [Pseudomonadota bacterium]